MTRPLNTRRTILAVSMRHAILTTALAAVTGVATLMPVQQANAASNLMELFRQKREAREMQRQQMPQAQVPQAVIPQAAGQARLPNSAATTQQTLKPTVPVKTVAVKGPQVYDYRPDKLVKIDFGTVDMQLTAAIPQPAKTDEVKSAPAVMSLPVRIYDDAAKLLNEAEQQISSMTKVETQSADAMVKRKKQVADTATIDVQTLNAALDAMKYVDVKAEQSIAEAIVAFYAAEHQLLWSDGQHVSQRAKDVVAMLAKADEDGLPAEEYAVTLPSDTFDTAHRTERLAQMADFELRLTARALRYALDAGEGRVIADRLSGFHDLPRNRIKPDQVLKALAQEDEPAVMLQGFNPQNTYYQKLKTQLAEMQPSGEKIARIAPDTLIKPGQTNAELPKIIALISKKAPAGYLNSYQDMFDRHAGSDLYDAELVSAVKDYQSLMGKAADGVIGRATITALQGESNSVKRDRILYSMERLRWLPRDFGQRYVFVNQPAYRAQYFNDGKEQLAMDVVVGSPRNQTHFFYDTIRTVVFNPSWGVPRSIVMNEMMPRILADSSYLDRNNYEVVSGGKVVPSSSVNWSSVAQGKGYVGVRQKPGPSNALGELKILFPNSHDIYLHDTPSKGAFKRDMRAVSHGCIRLADPRAMAAAVMGTGQENLTRFFGKNERGIKVPETMPIYLTYFTAWPDEASGKIRYYDDVYARDESMAKAFEKTSLSRVAAM